MLSTIFTVLGYSMLLGCALLGMIAIDEYKRSKRQEALVIQVKNKR